MKQKLSKYKWTGIIVGLFLVILAVFYVVLPIARLFTVFEVPELPEQAWNLALLAVPTLLLDKRSSKE